MLTTSAVLFGIAALGGVVLAFRDERPMVLSLVHGAVAAAGLVTLIMAVLQGANSSLPLTALALFVIAALGGFVLFTFHLRGRQWPKALIYVHGLMAVVAEVLLVASIF